MPYFCGVLYQILTTLCMLKLGDEVCFFIAISVPYKNTYTIVYISIITHQTKRRFRILNSFKKCMQRVIIGNHNGVYGVNLPRYNSIYTYINGVTSQTSTFSARTYHFLINYKLHIDGQGHSFKDI
jgi:hypothetical protein